MKVDDFDVEEAVMMHVMEVITTQQYTIQKGLKLLKDSGRQAVMKE